MLLLATEELWTDRSCTAKVGSAAWKGPGAKDIAEKELMRESRRREQGRAGNRTAIYRDLPISSPHEAAVYQKGQWSIGNGHGTRRDSISPRSDPSAHGPVGVERRLGRRSWLAECRSTSMQGTGIVLSNMGDQLKWLTASIGTIVYSNGNLATHPHISVFSTKF